jgi:hypothetical protein
MHITSLAKKEVLAAIVLLAPAGAVGPAWADSGS